MGFDFKYDFTPPTILLGLLLCPWRWGIFFGGIQYFPVDSCSAASCNFGVLAEDKHTYFYSTILLVYRKATDFCVLIFIRQLYSLMNSSSSLVESLEFSVYNVIFK